MFDLDDDEELNLQEQDNSDKVINDTEQPSLYTIPIFRESITYKKEDLIGILDPKDTNLDLLINYINKNKLTLVNFPEIIEKSILYQSAKNNKAIKIKSIIKVKAALLKKEDGARKKDFHFTHSPNREYYFFITQELNPNYMKPIVPESNKKKSIGKDRKESKDVEIKESNKIENVKINLNFDYNKYLLKAFIVYEKNGKMEVFHQEVLNREVCQVSHTTKESIGYYKKSKKLKTDRETMDLELFDLNSEKYFIIEMEHKKPASETIIKEDGILSVCYLITSEKKVAMNLYSMIKYSLYFIRETLCNYIGKYIRDMIYDFCHLPSECFQDFLSHIGSVTKSIKNKYKLEFPLKKYIKNIDELSKKCMVSHIYRNLPNISRPKAADKYPFHKFIFLFEKYKLYYEEKEFKIKQKYMKEDPKKKQKMKYDFLKQSLIKDSVNDKIAKENKIDLNKLITIFFGILEKYFKENFSPDREKIKEFLLPSLSKFLRQYSAFKGFLNIDLIINEDNKFEFQCSNNKACNRTINEKMFWCVVGSLKVINWIFGFNEGFFHEHFNIMDYSYNFNEKNVVHTFLTINDSSKKNRVRVFDIPFLDKWCYQIASLLFTIYRDSFGFLCNKDYLEKQKSSIDFHTNFAKLFSEIHDNVTTELFEYYEKVIPNYFEFCYKTSEAPLDKYNILDNLCQNFAKKSLNYLLKNNVIFFSPYEIVFEEELTRANFKKDLINEPNLKHIYEPYLILVDGNFKKYLDKKEKKDKFLKDNFITKKAFFYKLKRINVEKNHYTVFLAEKKKKELEIEIEKEDIDENQDNTEGDNDEETNDEPIISSKVEENFDENKIEKIDLNLSENSETIEEEKPININEVYPKKMPSLNIVNMDISKISPELYDFYFLLNLYYNFIYESMKELKQNFVNYDTLKRYIASIDSSVTISFSDYDKTIMKKINSNEKEKGDSNEAKNLKKGIKQDIINCLKIMSKLTRMTRHMNSIFINYMEKVINAIIKENKKIREKIGDDKNIKGGSDYFMKIGHFMVNFKAYRNNLNSFEALKESEIYKNCEKEDHYLSALEPVIEQIIIDK